MDLGTNVSFQLDEILSLGVIQCFQHFHGRTKHTLFVNSPPRQSMRKMLTVLRSLYQLLIVMWRAAMFMTMSFPFSVVINCNGIRTISVPPISSISLVPLSLYQNALAFILDKRVHIYIFLIQWRWTPVRRQWTGYTSKTDCGSALMVKALRSGPQPVMTSLTGKCKPFQQHMAGFNRNLLIQTMASNQCCHYHQHF